MASELSDRIGDLAKLFPAFLSHFILPLCPNATRSNSAFLVAIKCEIYRAIGHTFSHSARQRVDVRTSSHLRCFRSSLISLISANFSPNDNCFQMKFMNLWSLLAMAFLLLGIAGAATESPFSEKNHNQRIIRFQSRCPKGYTVVDGRCRLVMRNELNTFTN